MKPTELKNFIKENKVVSMMDLMMQFNADPDLIRQELQTFIDKGQIKKIENLETKCSSCMACGPMKFEVYEYLETRN